ncbi:hypothetical protein K3495_g14821 [Podosphaera aphanis]|nr:hypothetical protein K3495_g14821 [Podosphaera aphanis]
MKPASLKAITEFRLCKSTDLPKIEMRRGVEHVSEVTKESRYDNLSGKIIFIQGPIINPSKDAKFYLKVTDTSISLLVVEKHYTNKNSKDRTYATCITMGSKDGITDFIIGTGDRLREAIPMWLLENHSTAAILCGDGVSVVLNKEGGQESLFDKMATSVNSRAYPLWNTKVKAYYPLHVKKTSSLSPLKSGGLGEALFRSSRWGTISSLEGTSFSYLKNPNIFFTPVPPPPRLSRGVPSANASPLIPPLGGDTRGGDKGMKWGLTYFGGTKTGFPSAGHKTRRGISSKALNDIATYKKAYEKIKSKSVNLTEGSEDASLDGISLRKLEKLRNSITD